MKSVALFTVFLLCAHLSLQYPQLINCPDDFALTGSVPNECSRITCEGSEGYGGVGCPLWICQPGKQIGYKEQDNSKIYPECCSGPICEE